MHPLLNRPITSFLFHLRQNKNLSANQLPLHQKDSQLFIDLSSSGKKTKQKRNARTHPERKDEIIHTRIPVYREDSINKDSLRNPNDCGPIRRITQPNLSQPLQGWKMLLLLVGNGRRWKDAFFHFIDGISLEIDRLRKFYWRTVADCTTARSDRNNILAQILEGTRKRNGC